MLLEWVECVTLDTSRDISLIKDDVSKFTETWAVIYYLLSKKHHHYFTILCSLLCSCCTLSY